MVVHGDEMFLYGGHSVAQQPDGAELETVFDDMWRLDLKTLRGTLTSDISAVIDLFITFKGGPYVTRRSGNTRYHAYSYHVLIVRLENTMKCSACKPQASVFGCTYGREI